MWRVEVNYISENFQTSIRPISQHIIWSGGADNVVLRYTLNVKEYLNLTTITLYYLYCWSCRFLDLINIIALLENVGHERAEKIKETNTLLNLNALI